MKTRIFSLLALLCLVGHLKAQNVAINTTGAVANNSAMLDVDATNMGVLVPRVSLVAVTNGVTPISGPATSLLVFNTNAAVTGGSGTGYYYWDGTQWVRLFTISGASLQAWQLNGNAGINDPNSPVTYGTSTIGGTENWIGTTDANDFVIGTNTIERFRVKQTTGYVGIGTATPNNTLSVNNGGTTAGTPSTYPFAVLRSGVLDYTIGSDVSFAYEQSWNSKPLLINSQGNFVAINKTTAPIQHLDINGRLNVNNGVIQRGTVQINITSDLGLYSQLAGQWIRFATNAAPMKFFVDQNGGNNAGTNALMAVDNANGGGVKIHSELAGTGNAGSPDPDAALDVQSVTKGVLIPRMTTAQRDAIPTPQQGLTIYNTDTQCMEWWDISLGGTNKWNSYCRYCEHDVTISANASNMDFYTYLGSIGVPRGPFNYCVTINAGVTLNAASAGGNALTFTNMPDGAKIFLINNGRIVGGGGNGGIGGAEGNTTICSSNENDGGNGGAGGHAIATKATVPVYTTNAGLIAGGGGGGGGGDAGCCSAGGGGGGGAGIPAGGGGGGRTFQCASGTFCISCGASGSSAAGAAGNSPVGIANAPGGGGGANSGSSAPCGTAITGNAGGTGGSLGGNGVTPPNIACGGCSDCHNPGNGGAAGKAVSGGSGNQMTNIGAGLCFGVVD
jgi:hypothetical protein